MSKTAATPDELMSKTLPMAELVSVQPGAVVSRTVISKPAGTVTLFAFDKGQGLSTHSAPYDALVWILEGAAHITIEEKELVAKTGDMVIMPANRPHGLQANEPFKMALVMIKEKSAAPA
ncbi:MAG TPA: cupin domain-containing protein [Kiritimatiellia bacterium]|nr:cupin domain-containing protein [Kiritimatiellia bacterium]HQF21506.1 cupin domain-containing protein [Kiritimatiellia bacterium]HQG75548.1 cupin domain-containing protein [Kiritimatiellia bacterium]HQM22709.1 cupin domain-containing protein [Kiritimatiellia bacterium]